MNLAQFVRTYLIWACLHVPRTEGQGGSMSLPRKLKLRLKYGILILTKNTDCIDPIIIRIGMAMIETIIFHICSHFILQREEYPISLLNQAEPRL